jgi:hypothetical protein
MGRYIIDILIAIDQLVTTLVGGFPDETLSSYAYRLDVQGKPGGRIFRPIIDALFSWQGYEGGHCKDAYIAERARLQLPPEFRT